MFNIIDRGYRNIDRNSPEYLELIEQRYLYKLYGSDYKEMKWATEVLDRLENKSIHDYYTDQDRKEFYKARDIIHRVILKLKYSDAIKAEETLENHTTTHYIWRTRDDDKVRSRHAGIDDQIFSWDELPPGGKYPGEDYNCRCWAEAYEPEDEESRKETKNQHVTSAAADQGSPWNTLELSYYYSYGNGRALRLENIGLLGSVIEYAKNNDTGFILSNGSIFERVENQIFIEARANGRSSSFSGMWKRSYSFHTLVFGIGGAIVKGNYNVEMEDRGKFLIVRADIDYTFEDRFKDPLDTLNIIKKPDIELPGGQPFDINGKWSTHLEAIIRKDSGKSKYSQ